MLFWIGTAVMLVGFLFAIAARRHLGGNWSGIVTLKQDHTLIRSGPYRFVRDPIYTGLLLAIRGSGVIALGEWRGVVALALAIAAFLRNRPNCYGATRSPSPSTLRVSTSPAARERFL